MHRDSTGPTTEKSRDIVDASPFAAHSDRVVNKRIREFRGHVYNLQTEDGWYLANGIVVHNCRCSFSVADGPPPKEGRTPPAAFKTPPLREVVGQPAEVVTTRLGGRNLTFTAPPRQVVVEVDVGAIDQAWQQDPGYYLPRGGRGESEIEGRRARFREYLAGHDSIGAPQISVQHGGKIAFSDGRHRFAVLRDMGLSRIGVAIDPEDLNALKTIMRALGLE